MLCDKAVFCDSKWMFLLRIMIARLIISFRLLTYSNVIWMWTRFQHWFLTYNVTEALETTLHSLFRKRVMRAKLQQGVLRTVSLFMAFGQHNVWCESLSNCEWKSPSAGGQQPQDTRTCDQSAAVSGEGGDQSFMEASLFVALSPACWCSGTASPSKPYSSHQLISCSITSWPNVLLRCRVFFSSLKYYTLCMDDYWIFN